MYRIIATLKKHIQCPNKHPVNNLQELLIFLFPNITFCCFRDVVDLVGVHLELFRKNQAEIGVEVMVTLSSEERDERLKHHLMASNELHPALLSPESEYKV